MEMRGRFEFDTIYLPLWGSCLHIRQTTFNTKGRRQMRQSLLSTVVFGALFAAHPSFAADWTDANSNTYTALKYIKGERSSTNGGPYIITDVSPNCTDTVKLRCKLASIEGNECFFCSRATYQKNTNDRAFTCFRITSNIRVQRTGAV
jgi:hypothetical protein